MLNKLCLLIRIKKFYKTFGSEIGTDHITKWSDMTIDNVRDVLFDINEVRDGYELEYDEYEMTAYLNKLYNRVYNYCEA